MEPMGSLGELSLGDIGRALSRYKPVAATVLAILVALAVLPAPDRPPGLASTGIGDISTPAPAAASSSAGGAGTGATDDAAIAGDSFSPPVTSGSTSFPSSSSGSSFSSGPSDSASSDFPSGSSSDGSSSDFGPITSGTSTVDTTGEPEAPKPLQVVASAWASRTGGTPLAKDGVPAKTLPVGTRATTNDKLSFVRLAGDGTSLGFATDPAGAREVSGPAKVQACKVTEKWAPAEGIPIPDAPTYSETKCVQGTLGASGIWVFDLSSFADRADELGFALVPGDGAGVDFQVAFKL